VIDVLEEVVEFLVVNLKKGAVNCALGSSGLNLREDTLDSSRSNAQKFFIEAAFLLIVIEMVRFRPEHSKGFAAAGLPISENSAVEALQDLFWSIFYKLVNFLLPVLSKKN